MYQFSSLVSCVQILEKLKRSYFCNWCSTVLFLVCIGLDFKFTPGGDLNDDFCESAGPVNSKIYTLNTTGNIGSVKYTCSSADFLYYVEVYENGDIFLRNKFDREVNNFIGLCNFSCLVPNLS